MIHQAIYLEEQMQSERLDRAQSALTSGTMSVQAVGASTWRVDSIGSSSKGRQKHYTVSWNGENSGKDTGTGWVCTCPDFTGRCREYGLRCKHIEAVRFLLARDNHVAGAALTPPAHSTVRFSEERMSMLTTTHSGAMAQPPPTVNLGADPAPTDSLTERLRQPLDMNRVKRRQAPGQGTVPYLEGYSVIEIANELFQFGWSFDLLAAPTVMRWERVVTVYDQRTRKKMPVLGDDGKAVTETAGIVYITGRISLVLIGQNVSHADVGRCVFNGDAPEALDMAIAGAATDCLKRCFRQMGGQFGNSLYDKDIARTAGLGTGNPNGHSPTPGNGKSAVPSPTAIETLHYRDGSAVEADNTAEVNAFHAFKTAHQGQAPQSRESLRTWVKEKS